MKVLIILFFTFLTNHVNAQIPSTQDSVEVKCDKVFTRCEEAPSLKHGTKSYQNLLTNYLTEKKQFPTTGRALFYLVISKTGEVLEINVRESSITNIEGIISAIKTFPNEWRPGKQNNHIVCSYQKIEIKVLKDKIKLIIVD